MTEEEWLAADDAGGILLHFGSSMGDRKLRLFAVACCRRIFHPVAGKLSQAAIEMSCRYAEGGVTSAELSEAQAAAVGEWDRLGTAGGIWVGPEQDNPFEWVTSPDAGEAAFQAAGLVAGDSAEWESRYADERAAQIPILHDVFGNPFRPVAFSPSWRTSTAVALASQMYESRDFGAMLILADALQDAGCDCADVLNHCRGPGPHVRGCWVVDLVLGKE